MKLWAEYLSSIRYMQYASTLAGSMMFSSRIICLTWNSPAIVLLQDGKTGVGKVSDDEASWIASLLQLGNLLGYIITTYLTEKFGQRSCLLFTSMNMWIPWMIIAFSNSVIWICIARFILGLMSAVCILCSIIYVGEISDQDIRGRSSTLSAIVGSLANLYIYAVGPLLSYVTLSLSCMMVSSVAFLLLICVPESPYYHVRKGRMEAAKASIQRLSPRQLNEEELLQKMQTIIEYTHVHSEPQKKMKLWDLFSNKGYRAPLATMIGIRTFTIFTGGVIMTSYFHKIINQSKGSVSSETAGLFLGLVQFPSATLVLMLVDKVGRRPLLVTSYFGTSVTLFTMGLYFFIKDVLMEDTSRIGWLPTASFLCYTVIKQLGVTNIPNILQGEVFASKIKSVAVAFLAFYGTTLNFLLLKCFFPLCDYLGIHIVFWGFAASSAIASIFVFVFVPETKNKSFADIQAHYNKDDGNVKCIL